MKKYELLKDDTITVNGKTLYRIKALVAIGLSVAPGDLGGYVEKEGNLSMSGDAWVSDNAQVSGDAWVFDNAQVYGNARVSGDAWVSGNAQVYGNARVYGDASVSGNAQVYGNARVYGDARVSGDAWVFDNAQVYGNARVSGDAWVSGNAQVYGNARVYGDARVHSQREIISTTNVGTENGTLTVTTGKHGLVVTRGCFTGTVDEFLTKSKAYHDDKTHQEYKLLIEFAKLRIEKHTVNDDETAE